MLGEVADMRSVKMVNRKRAGKKPGTKWSRKMGRAGMLMGERYYAPVEADDRWGERNRAAQAEREKEEQAFRYMVLGGSSLANAYRETHKKAASMQDNAIRTAAKRLADRLGLTKMNEQAEAARRQAAVESAEFAAAMRELEEQVRDVDFERPLPRREKSILTRENLRIADELAGVSRPLAGCSACLLVVLVVALVVAVLSFFV